MATFGSDTQIGKTPQHKAAGDLDWIFAPMRAARYEANSRAARLLGRPLTDEEFQHLIDESSGGPLVDALLARHKEGAEP